MMEQTVKSILSDKIATKIHIIICIKDQDMV